MRQPDAAGGRCAPRGPGPAERFEAVVACTREIVELAAQRRWREVAALATRRRDLLEALATDPSSTRHADCIIALRGAVRESDAFLASVAAHA